MLCPLVPGYNLDKDIINNNNNNNNNNHNNSSSNNDMGWAGHGGRPQLGRTGKPQEQVRMWPTPSNAGIHKGT